MSRQYKLPQAVEEKIQELWMPVPIKYGMTEEEKEERKEKETQYIFYSFALNNTTRVVQHNTHKTKV